MISNCGKCNTVVSTRVSCWIQNVSNKQDRQLGVARGQFRDRFRDQILVRQGRLRHLAPAEDVAVLTLGAELAHDCRQLVGSGDAELGGRLQDRPVRDRVAEGHPELDARRARGVARASSGGVRYSR